MKVNSLSDIPKQESKYFDGIPKFKIVYKKITQPSAVITVCELRALDDNTKLAYGMTSTKNIAGYSPILGKKIAFSQACHYLFMQINEEKPLIIEDKTGDIPKEKVNGNKTESVS